MVGSECTLVFPYLSQHDSQDTSTSHPSFVAFGFQNALVDFAGQFGRYRAR